MQCTSLQLKKKKNHEAMARIDKIRIRIQLCAYLEEKFPVMKEHKLLTVRAETARRPVIGSLELWVVELCQRFASF